MVESRKPRMGWNPASGRWEFWGKDKTGCIAFFDGSGLTVNKGSLSYSSLTVATLSTTRTLVLTTIGSLADARIERLKVAGGGTISVLTKLSGTIPLTNVPTNSYAVATITGMGSAGIAVGDLIFPQIRATGLVTAVGLGQVNIPTTNVVTVKLNSVGIETCGSQSPVGIDLWQIRSA